MFDYAIALIGVEPFTGGTLPRGYEAIGYDILEEARELKSRVKKMDDITRECSRIASNREYHAKEAESNNHLVTARDNYFAAAIMYGCARWPIWDDDDPKSEELTVKLLASYQKYASLSNHRMERVEIAFEGKKLYGYLHLPPGQVKPAGSLAVGHSDTSLSYPCVVAIPGMDTFKEEAVRTYNDKFLERGFAVFAVDGPGQGESLARGLKLTKDNYDRAGKAIMDYLVTNNSTEAKIDKTRIGIYAASFGSYWGPRIMAYDSRYFAGTFTNICHEPHMETIFNGTLPSFKARHMYMTGIYDEEVFDSDYRSALTLEGVGEKIGDKRVLIAAGSNDPLSPIEHTYKLFNSIASPSKRLLVYEGEEHRISDPLLPSRIGDFMEDASSGKKVESGAFLLERGNAWKSMRRITP